MASESPCKYCGTVGQLVPAGILRNLQVWHCQKCGKRFMGERVVPADKPSASPKVAEQVVGQSKVVATPPAAAETSKDKPKCKFCQSENLKPWGKYKKTRQIWMCMDCKRRFYEAESASQEKSRKHAPVKSASLVASSNTDMSIVRIREVILPKETVSPSKTIPAGKVLKPHKPFAISWLDITVAIGAMALGTLVTLGIVGQGEYNIPRIALVAGGIVGASFSAVFFVLNSEISWMKRERRRQQTQSGQGEPGAKAASPFLKHASPTPEPKAVVEASPIPTSTAPCPVEKPAETKAEKKKPRRSIFGKRGVDAEDEEDTEVEVEPWGTVTCQNKRCEYVWLGRIAGGNCPNCGVGYGDKKGQDEQREEDGGGEDESTAEADGEVPNVRQD